MAAAAATGESAWFTIPTLAQLEQEGEAPKTLTSLPPTPVPCPCDPWTPLNDGYFPESLETVGFFLERLQVHRSACIIQCAKLECRLRVHKTDEQETLLHVQLTAKQIALVEERMGRAAFDDITASRPLAPENIPFMCQSFHNASVYCAEIKTLAAQQSQLLTKLTCLRNDIHSLEGQVLKLRGLPATLKRLGLQYQHNAKGLRESRQVLSEQIVITQSCASPFHHYLDYNAAAEAFALYHGGADGIMYMGGGEESRFVEQIHLIAYNRLKLYAVRYELAKRLKVYAAEPVY